MYVGCENLVGRNSLQWRWILTFAFGLFHGLGFASVLREMGVGESSIGIALPLISFNLGVETGQLSITALILPLAWKTKESANLSRIAVVKALRFGEPVEPSTPRKKAAKKYRVIS